MPVDHKLEWREVFTRSCNERYDRVQAKRREHKKPRPKVGFVFERSSQTEREELEEQEDNRLLDQFVREMERRGRHDLLDDEEAGLLAFRDWEKGKF